ncbi:ABC transporter substrate-binding protein [Bradyrhizobium sp. 44]|uniref:ABC transporter substrate-binding protein n=1 Tax=unclassified Bradyrhizobium TaxID=2631580 RepID=UPI001FFAF976|nr:MULTISPECIES: ABC transporter substrate-binding protein [unclassified Bradyrhizobium]MCK1288611.1 ABC transporter substrate-binding protein [Bradyrhizobium sp. 44]UPJ43980.1 ABC transporter substrate-binding protein [Bradyrhizobium sp. 40]
MTLIRRRDVVVAIGMAVATRSPAAAAEHRNPVVGFLSGGAKPGDATRLAALWRGLNEGGYVEGRNVTTEYRGADGQNDRLPALVAELIRAQAAVIVALGGPSVAAAAKRGTEIVPVVFTIGSDPVQLGLVASLNRPGANVTGTSSQASAIVVKQLEAVRELKPSLAVVGCLVNPHNPNADNDVAEVRQVALTLGLQVRIANASAEADIPSAFATLAAAKVDAVVVVSDGFLNGRTGQIAELAARSSLPSISTIREFALAGGLMSYGSSLASAYRQSGIYAGRILKGEKAADLPVQRSDKVELVINLKTAKALRLDMPLNLLGRADEIIE